MLQKCEGIVIRTHDYSESNKIVTIYTREWGKVGVMAQGAKKPNSRFAAVTQPFTYGYFLLRKGRSLHTLSQGEIIDSMRDIKEDIFLTAYASYIAELTDKAVEESRPNPYLFELFYQILRYINEGYDPEVMMFIYELKMLNSFGLYPILNECAVCKQTEGQFAFSIRENGFICHRCIEKDPYHYKTSVATLKLLRVFYYLDIHRLGTVSVSDETKKEVRMIIDAYYDEYSGLRLKSKRFLQQMEQLKSKEIE